MPPTPPRGLGVLGKKCKIIGIRAVVIRVKAVKRQTNLPRWHRVLIAWEMLRSFRRGGVESARELEGRQDPQISRKRGASSIREFGPGVIVGAKGERGGPRYARRQLREGQAFASVAQWQSTAFVMLGLWVQVPPLALSRLLGKF